MATDARGHTVPAGSDAFDPQGSDVALSLSINDPVISVNDTDMNAKAASIGASLARPLFVFRTDVMQLLVHNGTKWSLVGPPLLQAVTNVSPAGAAVVGYADVASTTATFTLACDMTAMIHFGGSIQVNGAANMELLLNIDGGDQVAGDAEGPAGINNTKFGVNGFMKFPLAAGSHTVKLRSYADTAGAVAISRAYWSLVCC